MCLCAAIFLCRKGVRLYVGLCPAVRDGETASSAPLSRPDGLSARSEGDFTVSSRLDVKSGGDRGRVAEKPGDRSWRPLRSRVQWPPQFRGGVSRSGPSESE